MSLQDYSAELEAENDRLRAALDERDARIDALGEAMLEMARRLDEHERPEPPEGSERSEWFGTVQWSGPSADYVAFGPEINRKLAQEISRMARDSHMAGNNPNRAEIGSERGDRALSQAIEVHEAPREVDTPKGGADEV